MCSTFTNTFLYALLLDTVVSASDWSYSTFDYYQELHHVTRDESCTDDDVNHKWNLVLEGGGFKGLSYIGALKALADKGFYRDGHWSGFENITGTSVGCLFGLIVALDIDPIDLQALIERTKDFNQLFDEEVLSLLQLPVLSQESVVRLFDYVRFSMDTLNYIKRVISLWYKDRSPGLTTGDMIFAWFTEHVLPLSPYRDRFNGNTTTMSELRSITKHRLTCLSARSNSYRVPIARLNDLTSPNNTVFDVVYASFSIPVLFKPLVDDNGPFLDGGLLDNFAIYDFDYDGVKSSNTLGLSLHAPCLENPRFEIQCNKPTTDDLEQRPINSLIRFIKRLMHIVIDTRSYLVYANDPRNTDRVIYLESRLDFADPEPDPEDVQHAMIQAYQNTLDFFQHRGGTNRCGKK